MELPLTTSPDGLIDNVTFSGASDRGKIRMFSLTEFSQSVNPNEKWSLTLEKKEDQSLRVCVYLD